VSGDLAAIASGLRAAALAGAWRDEELAVRNDAGVVVGAIERAAVRALGIPTVAVHLLAVDPQGHHWVQQRALDKDTDPGLWDTLVGGMVPAGEPLLQALERETWEEAGLRVEELLDLRHGGTVRSSGPSSSAPHGYVVQDLEWFTCTVPAGMLPSNQDGEVMAFECLAPAELARRLEQDEFTMDAMVLYAAAFATPG
jgi:8-oxo-dGTP pyrophosphatase MutT (NUDIX family)